MSESKDNLIKKLALEVTAEQKIVIELRDKIDSLEQSHGFTAREALSTFDKKYGEK